MFIRIISIFFLAVALVVVGVTFLRPKSNSTEREVAISNNAVTNTTSHTEARLPVYTSEARLQATASGGKAIIFFYAPWCPTCRAAEDDIVSKFDQIPSDVTILKADYDSERELKKQYNITTQHTFVQVDTDGNEISKWIGGDTLQELLANIK